MRSNLTNPIDDVDLLRGTLYEIVFKKAKHLQGDQVARALKEASEELFETGVDEALRQAEKKIDNWSNIASAWDLVWMSRWIQRLDRQKPNTNKGLTQSMAIKFARKKTTKKPKSAAAKAKRPAVKKAKGKGKK